MTEGGSAVRVGGARTRAGEKGAGSAFGCQDDVSLKKKTDFTSRAGGSAPFGVEEGLFHFDSSCNLLVLHRCTPHSLYKAFTDMLSFLSCAQKPNVGPCRACCGGPCITLRGLQNKTHYPNLQVR